MIIRPTGLSASSMLPIAIAKSPAPIGYPAKILLIGSCFTSHIAARLSAHKFEVLENPNGILFNPISVVESLMNYAAGKRYNEELFQLNELWCSWDFHSDFSHINKQQALVGMNDAMEKATAFLQNASHLIITLGSSFYYKLLEQGRAVANNHRAPENWFSKEMLPISQTVMEMKGAIGRVRQVNASLKVIFTISPVRHVREGVIQNNRSKARLVEAVQQLCEELENVSYFPAYELLIDVLRDYRYYDADMVHPNYAATSIVWEEFVKSHMEASAWPLMKELNELDIARRHRPRFSETEAHKRFERNYVEKAKALQQLYPFLDLSEEIKWFGGKAD